MPDSILNLLATLLAARTTLHAMHWATPSGPQHEALGGLYVDLLEDTDKLAEVAMGTFGRITALPVQQPDAADDLDPAEFVGDLQDHVKAARATLPQDETHLLNIVDEILGNLSRAMFKLDRLA